MTKKFLLYCPLITYCVSRLIYWKQWKQREILFKQRTCWQVEEWVKLSKGSFDKNLTYFVLKEIGRYFLVDWKRIRPEDSFENELKVPMEKLHCKVLGECIEDIITNVESTVDLRTSKILPVAKNIFEFVNQIHYFWHEFPHFDKPFWEQ